MDSQHGDTRGEPDNRQSSPPPPSSSEENGTAVVKTNATEISEQHSCSSSPSSSRSDKSFEDADKPKLQKKLSFSFSLSSPSLEVSSKDDVSEVKQQSTYLSSALPPDKASDINAAEMCENRPTFDKQSSFSSTSSAAYSEESLFQLDASDLGNPAAGHGKDIELAAAKTDMWSAWPGEEQDEQGLFSYVPSTNPGPDSSTMFGPTQAPPVQTMAQPDGFDPNRIPASIFRTKSTTPAEWSVTSTDSLFSIHIARSGDLGSLYNGQIDYLYDAALQGSTTPIRLEPEWRLPALDELHDVHNMDGVSAANAGGHATKDLPMPDTPRSDGSGSAKGKKSVRFHNDSLSDGSSKSNYSFAFPILADASPKNNSLYQPLRKGNQRPSASLTEDTEAAPSTAKRRCFPFRYSWFACSWQSCFPCCHCRCHCCQCGRCSWWCGWCC